MSDPSKSSSDNSSTSKGSEPATHVVDLLVHYGFDLGGKRARQLVDFWQANYSANWVRWAVIEALYQGRYKAISVEQILQLWQRRQQPCYHFNYEFERLVCNKFPRDLSQPRSPQPAPDFTALPAVPSPTRPPREAKLATLPTPVSEDPPAWAELAEQIQKESEEPEPTPGILPLEVDRLEPPEEILLNRVARLQAGVDALIEQATSSLNASTEAMKTRWQNEEFKSLTNGQSPPEPDSFPELSEEVHPPIHQFMPTATEFHNKLKAVVEQEESAPSD
ncbi:MAG: hypothetical protein MUC48_03360 [Leptolyngbya sp. Prado105]|nr:hypothetical protein [Leptolyngbya sp. Prado105]